MTGTIFDLGAQVGVVARLAAAVPDTRLEARTPCPDWVVGDLLGHLVGLSVAFRDAGRKDLGVTTDTVPGPVAPALPADWRVELPRVLDELVEAWRDPVAWAGTTRAGGVDLPGAVAGVVAVDELVVHGWDLARATGQEYVPDPGALRAAHAFLEEAVADGDRGGGVFGPVVPVPDDAPLLERVLGLSGRDPRWSPPSGS
ncbi:MULTISPECIES: TIGR03086 family metal-binding protein [unclassified Streptomyces]|uniref:TIGR03086 family metal-binding protein n=1 Tax=unclassified Streptomyces TaxID=2593676 RepID=UPI0004BDAAF6|nr:MULTISPECIES: TIGR03086 family metal-binding protein [unclassified Streptomyces]